VDTINPIEIDNSRDRAQTQLKLRNCHRGYLNKALLGKVLKFKKVKD